MRNRRRLPEPAHGLVTVLLLVDKDNHPDAHCAGRAEQRCAVYPPGPAFFVRLGEVGDGAREPPDFGGHAAGPVGEGGSHGLAYARAAADAVEEVGLQDAGDAEGGGSEEDAEGGGGPDEEVLLLHVSNSFV